MRCAGFYDDNYTTAPDNSVQPSKTASDLAIEPSVSLNLPREQTYIGFTAGYSGRYFEDREDNNMDHAFLFTGALTHTFSPQYKLDIRDNFVVAQESELDRRRHPACAAKVTTFAIPCQRYLHGRADGNVEPRAWVCQHVRGLRSGRLSLDRIPRRWTEWSILFSLTGRMQIAPPTTLLAGYQYGMADYTSDDLVAPGTPASVRDSRSHFLFGGVEHSFSPQLAASLRGGAQMPRIFPIQS